LRPRSARWILAGHLRHCGRARTAGIRAVAGSRCTHRPMPAVEDNMKRKLVIRAVIYAGGLTAAILWPAAPPSNPDPVISVGFGGYVTNGGALYAAMWLTNRAPFYLKAYPNFFCRQRTPAGDILNGGCPGNDMPLEPDAPYVSYTNMPPGKV